GSSGAPAASSTPWPRRRPRPDCGKLSCRVGRVFEAHHTRKRLVVGLEDSAHPTGPIMRIGIFGGTFDPVHMGHLILAEQCRDQAQLDEVRFLPSYRPPHKAEQAVTRFEHRCDMIELATAGHPAFRLDRIEKELPP